MTIIYSVVARGQKILCDCTIKGLSGNHAAIVKVLLQQLPKDKVGSFQHDEYAFHTLKSNNIIYLCMNDISYPPSLAQKFLNTIKNHFVATYGDRSELANSFPDFPNTLEKNMIFFNKQSKTAKIQEEIGAAQDKMRDNMKTVLRKGQKLEVMISKAEDLEESAVDFGYEAKTLYNAKRCQKIKMNLLITFVVLAIIYFFLGLICGFDLSC